MQWLRERERERERTYEQMFYTERQRGEYIGAINGFPMQRKPWCVSKLKISAFKNNIRKNFLSCSEERGGIRVPYDEGELVYEQLKGSPDSEIREDIYGFPGLYKMGRAQWCTGELKVKGFSQSTKSRGANTNIVRYIGIAADEPERIKKNSKPGYYLPLVEAGWDEPYCRQWCEENNLLSPIYTTATRGGCWFCHNQSIDQLRLLRKNYPDLWELLLKWDKDSPVTFHADGRTVHDFDRRFAAEDKGLIVAGDRKFRWKKLEGLFQEPPAEETSEVNS